MKQGITRILRGFLSFLVLAMILAIPAPTGVLAAGNANLVLIPASMTVTVGSSFDVAIQVQANGEQVTGVQAFLDFDPAKLTVNSVTPATTWSGKPVSVFDATSDDSGKINFGAGIFDSAVTGTFTIVTVRFTARAVTNSTAISFHFKPPDARDTGISDTLGFNLLGTATGATITIIGTGGAGGGGSATAPQLVSMLISPTDPSISQGASLQFAAMGSYADKSTTDITNQVVWSSSDTAVASIQTTGGAAPGLATGLAAGTATITATLGTITASTKLMVKGTENTPVIPPTITTPTTPVATSTPSTPPSSPTPSASTPSTPSFSTPVTPPVSSSTPPPQPPPTPPSGSGTPNWLLLGGIAIGAVIVVVVSFLLLKK